jgi:hypothetical protein
MSIDDSNAPVSDREVLSALRSVFGDNNVIPHWHPDALENSFTMLVGNSKAASQVVELFANAIPDLLVFEGLGGFVATRRNQIGIALGTENRRRHEPSLNAQTQALLSLLQDRFQALKLLINNQHEPGQPRRQ